MHFFSLGTPFWFAKIITIIIIIISITSTTTTSKYQYNNANHHHHYHKVGATILVFATLPFSLCCVIKIVKEYERAVIFRFDDHDDDIGGGDDYDDHDDGDDDYEGEVDKD